MPISPSVQFLGAFMKREKVKIYQILLPFLVYSSLVSVLAETLCHQGKRENELNMSERQKRECQKVEFGSLHSRAFLFINSLIFEPQVGSWWIKVKERFPNIHYFPRLVKVNVKVKVKVG